MGQAEKTSNFNKVTSSDKSKQTCSFVLLLILLVKIGLATSSLYVVTGAYEEGQSEQYGPNGIYEEKREPELHYQKLGDPDPDGHYTFLYTDSHRQPQPQTVRWILGKGRTLSTAVAQFSTHAVDGEPIISRWLYELNFGSSSPRSDMRVLRVDANITGEELTKQLQRGEDFVTEKYIVCKLDRPYFHPQAILRDSNDPVYCNAARHCESYERCQVLTVPGYINQQGSFGNYNITKEQWTAGEATSDDTAGQSLIACKNPRDRKWQVLSPAASLFSSWEFSYI